MQRYKISVKLFHSVAMVCDLSPCYSLPYTADTRPDVVLSFYCKGTQQVHVQLERALAREREFSQAFQKDITDQIKVISVLAVDTQDFAIL